ncbi:hypothetical protein [Streptomyces griseocarneus]|uniref:hypothetical protein n=1 Tax=Streptomyces griseocarneus TaxID=51201 RepID=UPI00167D9B3A|nr:hypothetical protein [Streptomyces griseocarneus]MBZ6475227.1 hypothetical protein [Streptomyces griseocarneus]GHG61535.1 hypothetical protein GCM10018779_29510 [Streptomyces griseocarneus]
MSTAETPRAGAPLAPETTGIRTLGYANRFSTWDSEFRYDGRIRVPMGVKIKQVAYSYTGSGTADTGAGEVKRGQGGTGQEYEVIDLTFLEDADLITFTLRGDLNVDKDARPAFARTYPIRVDVTLDNGDVRTATPEVEVLNGAWQKSDPEKVGRPFVRLPYDNNWGGKPNSQAGFGHVSDNGRIPDDKFIIDLVNLREGEQGVPSNHSDHVYYQLVHEDGTPSRYTPTPQLQKAEGHKGSGTDRKVTLPAIDLRALGDKPGYYRFLVWPQSVNPDGSPSSLRWDPAKPGDAFQIGSVYYRYRATAAVDPELRATVEARPLHGGDPVVGKQWVYPPFVLHNTGQRRIGTVPVVFTAPEGMRFREDQVTFTRWTDEGREETAVGVRSADRRTLTCPAVPLDLEPSGPGRNPWVSLYPAMDVETTAVPGPTQVGIQVGDPIFATGHNAFRILPRP